MPKIDDTVLGLIEKVEMTIWNRCYVFSLCTAEHPAPPRATLVGWWVACCSAGGWQPCRWGSGMRYWQRCHNQRARTVCVLCVSEYYSKKHYRYRCITTVCVISSFSLLSLFFLFLSLFRQFNGQFEYRNVTSTQIIPEKPIKTDNPKTKTKFKSNSNPSIQKSVPASLALCESP